MPLPSLQAGLEDEPEAPEWDGRATVMFRGPALSAKVLPFAVIALVAEISLALPPGVHSKVDVFVSAALLVASMASFALPWRRLPIGFAVVVPLLYMGSMFAMLLAGGKDAGIGIVLLAPLVWTALFHRKWDAVIVVTGVVGVEAVVSVMQSASIGVTLRRAVLWAFLSCMLTIAIHGLRDRSRRFETEREAYQERLAELAMEKDRMRIASELQEQVIERVFSATLSLHGMAQITSDAEAGERITRTVEYLDEAIRLLRRAVFGLDAPAGQVEPTDIGSEVLYDATREGSKRFAPGDVGPAEDGPAEDRSVQVDGVRDKAAG